MDENDALNGHDISADLQELRVSMSAMDARLTTIETSLEGAVKQIGFLAPQMRMILSKIDGVAISTAEPRLRNILLSLINVYDLVDQALRTFTDSESDAYRTCAVLETQMRQILEYNGLLRIETDGPFDPQLHRVIRTIPCQDPAEASRIVEVIRSGFRTDQAVLRYADVTVSQYVSPAANDEQSQTAKGQ